MASAMIFMGLVPSVYAQEGSDQLGLSQRLRAATDLYVDIVDATVETITWNGTGTVTVTGPTGAVQGSLGDGDTLTPTDGDGAYKLNVNANQSANRAWNVTVNQQTAPGGRLYSRRWVFNTGSFDSAHATSASFYGRVLGGDASHTPVVELKLGGLSGYGYDVTANESGVGGDNAGRSVPISGHAMTPEFDLFLNPPTVATYTSVTPTIASFRWNGPPAGCAVGGQKGSFSFVTNVRGTAHLICDINKDGIYDRSSSADLVFIQRVKPGLNDFPWDGSLSGHPVADGTYDCLVHVNVGEFHYVGRDIETSYPGMRFYGVTAVSPTAPRVPLAMYWNDSFVQSNALNMPTPPTPAEQGLERSGADGIRPGAYGSAAVANTNARSWGHFNGSGKGNNSFLNTFAVVDSTTSTTIKVDSSANAPTGPGCVCQDNTVGGIDMRCAGTLHACLATAAPPRCVACTVSADCASGSVCDVKTHSCVVGCVDNWGGPHQDEGCSPSSVDPFSRRRSHMISRC